jgi:glucose-1-phosphate adenylyltransferase
MNDLHGILLAYRSNISLRELVQHRNICSIPFGGRYRVIDFMLSNFVNAGVSDVGLIVHSSYQSLLDHVGSGKDWDLSRKHGGLHILPPFGYAESSTGGDYLGRMDALAGVRSYLSKIRQDFVVIASGDIVANLPIADAFEQHLRTGADITAICTHHHTGDSPSCTYFTVGSDGRVADVAVHPNTPAGCESLECYIMSTSLLLSLTDYAAAHKVHSFSEGVLLGMSGNLSISPYLYDGHVARFRTVPSYFAKSMELLDPAVQACLFDPARPIRTKDQSNPSTYYGPEARSSGSLIADGCIIEGTVENSILFRGVRIGKGCKISNCILMQSTTVQRDATLSYVVTDKNVTIHPNRTLMGHASYPLAIAKNATV